MRLRPITTAYAISAAAIALGTLPAFAVEPIIDQPVPRPAMTAPAHTATATTPRKAAGLKTGRSVATTPRKISPRPVAADEGLSAAEASAYGYLGDGATIANGYGAGVPAFAQAAVLAQAPALAVATAAQAPAAIAPAVVAAAPAVIAQASAVLPTYVAPATYTPTTYTPAPAYTPGPAVTPVATVAPPQPYGVAVVPVAGYDVQTGRSVAIAAVPGNTCTTPVRVCVLEEESYVGTGCSCHIRGGQARGFVTP